LSSERAIAEDEMSRAQPLDQKTAGLIAAALVLVAAAVAFASHLNEVSASTGARTLWGALIVVLLVLLLAYLAFATAVIHPQPFRVTIHEDELAKGQLGTPLRSSSPDRLGRRRTG
jgi:membrane protein YdbS with pleckstrin-like domain